MVPVLVIIIIKFPMPVILWLTLNKDGVKVKQIAMNHLETCFFKFRGDIRQLHAVKDRSFLRDTL